MFATFPRTRNQRRGVVLILVLGMLGLLALIGVTFATFSGQVKVNARNFSQAQNWPESTEMMDYALAQLIDDTDNPQSAIRGHSLKRDMYGNDGLYNSALAFNPANGLRFEVSSAAPVPVPTTPPTLVSVTDIDGTVHNVCVDGLIRVVTNIASNEPALYGYNFTRWIMRFPPVTDTTAASATTPIAYYPSETHEILADVQETAGRVFYLAPDDKSRWPGTTDVALPAAGVPLESPRTYATNYAQSPTIPYPLPNVYGGTDYQPSGSTAPPIQNYNFYNYNYVTNAVTTSPGQSTLVGLQWRTNNPGVNSAATFTLDGRFLHAFNGPGVSGLDQILDPVLGSKIAAGNASALQNRGMAQYANFRTNGNILSGNINTTDNFQTPFSYGSPSTAGMDEDYDAVDLENWFLAMQSGDGQVVIPSFHRPGILISDSTVTAPTTNDSLSYYDDWTSQNPFSASKILRPRNADGHSKLAFPDLHPDPSGKIQYDVDNDGDGFTDSVWLDLGYPARRNTDGRLFKPLFAFMVIGLNGRIPLNTAGNLQLRSLLGQDPVSGIAHYGVPLLDHASGKGYSPSEINPTYALQNAFIPGTAGVQMYSPTDNAGGTTGGSINGSGVYTAGDGTNDFTTYPTTQWWGNAGVPVSLTQLRNLLAGTRSPGLVKNSSGVDVPTSGDSNFVFVNGKAMYLPNGVLDEGDTGTTTTTTPIAGRWGEPTDQPLALSILPSPNPLNAVAPPLTGWTNAPPIYQYENQVRAGVSGQWTSTGPRYGDARDDNRNAFDWYPSNTVAGAAITTLGENADFLDLSGSLVLPVERMRRFVTPIDVMGDGIVNSFANPFSMAIGTTTPLLGADGVGRVAYVKHFRPPGLALATPPGLDLPAAPLPATAPATPTKPTWYPYETGAYWLQGVGKPAPPMNAAPGGVAPNVQVIPVDLTNNLYRGFESYRMPKPPGDIVTLSQFIGGMPSNTFPDPTAPPVNSWAPRFDQSINTLPVVNPNTLASSSYPWLANLNEADEMNVYSPQSSDQPFGPSDLEWLYRQQDTDGLSLASRLKDLAPVSFTNPKDGTRRRRLFSIESWEPTSFIWANDNPAGDPQWPLVTATNAPYGNSHFYAAANSASGPNLSLKDATLSTIDYLHGFSAEVYDSRHTSVNYTVPRRLPSLAHRDRKINLNYPLPVSNRYDEPVRQKWIRETYQLLKMILPPKAVDTPEELVQLSQFVTNIIDFRDPDCTSTRFVNTDVYYATAATPTNPATLAFTPAGGVLPTQLGAPWNGTTNVPPPSYSQLYDNQNSPYVIQYGMEYNPVAITEVLAYTFEYSGGPMTGAPRMFVELVNTLTAPALAPTATNSAGSDPRACDLKLNGWDFIILPDTPAGRPDPFTGQLPLTTLPPAAAPAPPLGVTTSNRTLATIGTTDPGGLTTAIPAMTGNRGKAYVIQNAASTSETSAPSADATIDLVNNTNMATATTGNYYWLYLRRPANPFDTSYDPTRPNENRVVVDCFRFLYNKATFDSAAPTEPATGTLYSQRRLQPYRGGHAVPPIPALGAGITPNYCVPAYGYTEQPMKGLLGDTGSGFKGNWNGTVSSTGAIYNTLGKAPGEDNANKDDYDWDMMPFNDRDFTSVAELLMVPGCPPGLFTKQFVEVSPPIPANPPTSGGTPPPLPILFTKPSEKLTAGSAGTPATTSKPHTFPYLMDEFFYTAQSEPSLTGSPIPTMVTWPVPAAGPAPIHETLNFPSAAFPITPAGTLNANYPVVPNYIGGPSGAGWFKMFDFFDVPSPANGSTGPVADGTNYDWARQDLKPGLLNLNLIMDEEVFFAVMSESWLKTLGYVRSFTPPFFSPSQEDIDDMGATRLNVDQLNLTNDAASPPKAVTQVNVNGFPNSSYLMPNQGFMALDPLASKTSTAPVFDNRMKAAFSDFLKLRHGGSGYMFAHQTGHVGDPNGTTTVVASERPFHSLSYPNVDYTVMRPAALPPTDSTTYGPWQPPWATLTTAENGSTPLYPAYVGDPGVKNPYLFTQNNPVSPPAVPARRLFQLPDVWGNPTFYLTATATNFPAPPVAPTDPAVYPGNGSRWESNYTGSDGPFTGDPFVNWQNLNLLLANTAVDLAANPTTVPAAATPPAPYVFVPNFYLGANTTTNPPAPVARNDNRQHPAFRYDWLHKVTNLTTVRTHQYAVWITVGFFEVTKLGDPTAGNAAPGLAYDRLGEELNIQNGKNVRYRSFFIIDRTRAVGFSPQAPGNFRECITYRQTIE